MKPGELVAAKYRIVGTIAVGGSGTVFRAERLTPEGDKAGSVALKLMHAEHPEGDTERQRFSREAEIIKQLRHPHIVQLFDYGHSEEGVPFLVFPLLEGRTLHKRIKKEGALDWREAGRLSLQILSALDQAHGIDIIHRDIKPPNIFLAASALGDNVQILDFGLAKVLNQSESAEVTRTGALIGTPRYMAPEQVRGEQVTHTADIYAFGLVMAEMLLGKPVVQADKEIDIYMTHGSDKELKLPVDLLRSPFATVIRRAVAKPLEVRYRKASQMLADVRAVMEKLTKGSNGLASADMEATFIVDPAQVLPLSNPTEMSEQLRGAFNQMANKMTEPVIDEAPPTLRRAVPDPAVSVPLLLTRKPDQPEGPEQGADPSTEQMDRPEELDAEIRRQAARPAKPSVPRSTDSAPTQIRPSQPPHRRSSAPPPLPDAQPLRPSSAPPPALAPQPQPQPHVAVRGSSIPPGMQPTTPSRPPPAAQQRSSAPPAAMRPSSIPPNMRSGISPGLALLFLAAALVGTGIAYLVMNVL